MRELKQGKGVAEKVRKKNLLFQGGHLSGAALEGLVDELLFIITRIPTKKE